MYFCHILWWKENQGRYSIALSDRSVFCTGNYCKGEWLCCEWCPACVYKLQGAESGICARYVLRPSCSHVCVYTRRGFLLPSLREISVLYMRKKDGFFHCVCDCICICIRRKCLYEKNPHSWFGNVWDLLRLCKVWLGNRWAGQWKRHPVLQDCGNLWLCASQCRWSATCRDQIWQWEWVYAFGLFAPPHCHSNLLLSFCFLKFLGLGGLSSFSCLWIGWWHVVRSIIYL
jgi:hypothetical protein